MEIPRTSTSPLVRLAALVIVVAGLKAAAMLVLPFLLAVFLAIICAPPLFWLQKKGCPTLIGILLLISLAILLQVLLLSMVSGSIKAFVDNLPFYQGRLKDMMVDALGIFSGYGLELNTAKLVEAFSPNRIMGFVASTLDGLSGVLTNMFFVFLTLMFILLELSGFPSKIKAIADDPDSKLDISSQIIYGVNRYLLIKTGTSMITGAAIALWLMIQGVDFYLMWGVFAFLLNYIPSIGSVIAAVPAVLLALVQLGPLAAGIAGVGYLIINTLVGSVIEPRAMGQGVGLSALVIFLSLAFWGWVLGPVGMLLSVPLTMIVKIALSSQPDMNWVSILLGSNKEAELFFENKGASSGSHNA